MSINRKLGDLANVLDDGTEGQVLTSQGSGVVAFADAAGGVTYYANISDLPASGNSNGDTAFVGENNRLYIFNGAGWYSVALLNQTPTFDTIQDASSGTTPFTLSTSGTATVISVAATDAEGEAITYGYSVSSGALNGSTVAAGTGAAYAIASASLLSGTYTVNSNAGALTFKPDGTEMYYVGTTSDRVSRHTLSTAWDVSTGSFVGSSPNTLSQVTSLTDVKFNNDGTKMYMADRNGATANTIYQYSLSTAWDVDTASYDNKSYVFTSVLTGDDLNCFVFNADGTAVYLAEHSPSSNIYQFTLSTAFDISTASYANKTLSLSSVASNGSVGRQYFQFTNDGTKLFLIHTFHPAGFVGKIYEYSLTTAYDISTASHTSVTYTPAGITTGRSAIAFKPDGTKMFIMGTDNHTTISQFNLPIYNTNDFIVQPHASNSTTFSLTFTASDGINTATSAAQSFTLAFEPVWTTGSQQAKIQPSDIAAGDHFGYGVTLSQDGNTAVIGSPNDDTYTGAVYVFTRSGSTWTQHSKLVANDAAQSNYFGRSEFLSGNANYLIVGSNYTDNIVSNDGSAYIFVRNTSNNTWSQQAILLASNAEVNDYFGGAVVLNSDGTYAAVGVPTEDTGGTNAGSVYIFSRSGSSWSEQAILQSSDVAAQDMFGKKIDFNSDASYLIVGTRAAISGLSYVGAAYIFTRSGSTWTQQAKLIASDPTANANFANVVKINSDATIAAMSSLAGDGSVYIFTRSGSTWSQQAKITVSASSTQFGYDIDLSDDGVFLLASARRDNTTANLAGAAYVFKRSGSTWTQQIKFQSSDVEADDQFGNYIALSGNGSTAIIGVNTEDTGGTNAGSAYIFQSS